MFRAAVIVDIVGSKRIADRVRGQRDLEKAFAEVDEFVGSGEPFNATVGDEFQAVYPSVGTALEATLAVRLGLPEGLDCRFGIGWGEIRVVGQGAGGPIQDGSAWWNARAAIDEAHYREEGRTPTLRTWFAGEIGSEWAAAVNSHLLVRDHLIGMMSARARRLASGTLRGRPQGELAVEEGVTQSAVSQSLRRSGAASLIAAAAMLKEAF